MPLDFVDVEKPRGPVEFFVQNKKARPLQLDSEVVPQLVEKVGDVKEQRISLDMVEQYLQKSVLVFDRELLRNMFKEADYKQLGALDAISIKAALSGRYPKRQYLREWRQLVAMLLGLTELVLVGDIREPKTYDGTFNKESVWTDPAPALPPVPKFKPRAKPAQGETTTNGTTTTLDSSKGKLVDSGTIRTPEGLKTVTPLTSELGINQWLQGGSPQSTFAATKDFNNFSKGLELTSSQGTCTMNLASAGGMAGSLYNASKASMKAWSATLTPTAIAMPPSVLQTLRNSVRSTISSKKEFLTQHRCLTTSDLEQKKTMGQELDVQMALSRVEPVRSTKVLFNAPYTEWCDYGSRCRTAPTKWYNEHPAVPPPLDSTNKYPWC